MLFNIFCRARLVVFVLISAFHPEVDLCFLLLTAEKEKKILIACGALDERSREEEVNMRRENSVAELPVWLSAG